MSERQLARRREPFHLYFETLNEMRGKREEKRKCEMKEKRKRGDGKEAWKRGEGI